MMTRQPPLLDKSGSDLPSPLFTGRPGWGGQLRSWLAENAYVVTFRLVLGVAMALVVVSVIRNPPTKIADVESLSPTPEPSVVEVYRVAARPGEGMSDLAGRAVTEHSAKHPEYSLSAGQRLYVVDTLWRTALALQSQSPFTLRVGQEVSFPHAAMEAAVSAFKKLSPAQQAAWERLTR